MDLGHRSKRTPDTPRPRPATRASGIRNPVPSRAGPPSGRIEARFATGALGSEASRLSLQRIAPGVRRPFAHRHASQEEVYVVVEGGGQVELDEEIIALAPWDAVRVARPGWRCFEGGSGGLTFLAFGAPPMADPGPGPRSSAAGGATDPVAAPPRYDPPSFVVDGGEKSARGVRSAVAG
jgi:mannose-6-phosphate isomerase-like protein (cupin superfamily)